MFAVAAFLLLFEAFAAVGLVVHVRALRAYERDVRLDLLEVAYGGPPVEHPLRAPQIR